ncbi:MAG: glycoside hydrolase family 2 TIM barrel-domain containing protein [Rikenellaceae bacterium]
MSVFKRKLVALALLIVGCANTYGANEPAMQNVLGRERQSLNGSWAYIADVNNLGMDQKWYQEVDRSTLTKFVEVNFAGEARLNVPGDWNSQIPELLYFESLMWYQHHFDFVDLQSDDRHFLHFAAVCSDAVVFLNGELLGEHSGGYTPFQFEVTDLLREGSNTVTVRVDNRRTEDSIPGMVYDWWNYGGITRDVDIVTTPATYIEDYWVRLDKGSMEQVVADVKLNGEDVANREVTVTLKGTKISKKIKTDANGEGSVSFRADLDLWSPQSPTLYDVVIESAEDRIEDKIGFRCFEVRGTKLYLNGEEIFLKGVNLHEEIPHERRRAVDAVDSEYLLGAVQELGCNFVRHAHYPPTEYTVRMCDQMGLMMWEEIPTWGSHIDFSREGLQKNAMVMMEEMIRRDKNRCGTIIWSVANETKPWDDARNEFLTKLMNQCREWDNTRAISTASNSSKYIGDDNKNLVLVDPLADEVDIIAVNKYLGWYGDWGASPEESQWITRDDKPMIVSEFGAGAVYGNHNNPENVNSFSEEYMADLYHKKLRFFENIPNYCGVTPWVMFDFRSTRRSNVMLQDGWNRKGLLSPYGEKKSAWYIMNEYYKNK